MFYATVVLYNPALCGFLYCSGYFDKNISIVKIIRLVICRFSYCHGAYAVLEISEVWEGKV